MYAKYIAGNSATIAASYTFVAHSRQYNDILDSLPLTWRNQLGYPAPPRLMSSSVDWMQTNEQSEQEGRGKVCTR
jgi:hypothetical protein